MPPTPLLEVSELSFTTAGGRTLFTRLNFELRSGQLLLVTGINGSGKSTLIKLITKEIVPASGLIRCTVPQSKIALMPQLQNMSFHLPMQLKDVVSIMVGRSANQPSSRLFQGLDLERAWNSASGGERQRTLLGCILLQAPQLLLLDEPFNHLDSNTQAVMLDLLEEFVSGSPDRAIVLVTHAPLPPSSNLGKVALQVSLQEPERSRV